jgi:hypothetical protein
MGNEAKPNKHRNTRQRPSPPRCGLRPSRKGEPPVAREPCPGGRVSRAHHPTTEPSRSHSPNAVAVDCVCYPLALV